VDRAYGSRFCAVRNFQGRVRYRDGPTVLAEQGNQLRKKTGLRKEQNTEKKEKRIQWREQRKEIYKKKNWKRK
jgi:hypothetical protein